MAIYNIHAGHGVAGGQGCGAVGLLDESTEARKVKDALVGLLQKSGHTVYDCTYNGSASQNSILSAIVKKCNAHSVDLDISIHLNSGRNDYVGDGSTGGVEVYGYDTAVSSLGSSICKNIAAALGITNRGFKTNKSLYVLNSTKAKAILIECCFVDDKDDANRWDASKCATAICTAITGVTVQKQPTASVEAVKTPTVTAKSVDDNVTVSYAVRAGGKTLPFVNGLSDYAGITGSAITDVAIKVNKGSVKYRVHVKGGDWLGYVSGCNWDDTKNGYAGNGKPIDAIEVYYNTPSDIVAAKGYKKAKYHVAPFRKEYYSWQYDNKKGNGMDGYAGSFGKSLDRLQITIE